jgi:hypothetical protein
MPCAMNQLSVSTDEARHHDETVAPVRFADASERSILGGAGMLVLRIERLGPAARGRLSDVIDEAMERELAARGASSPGVGSSTDADAALSDQLFRARQVGVRRVCVALGPMRSASSPSGALQAEDTATLLFWARATRDRPVELVLDTTDELTEGFVTPIALKAALGLAPPLAHPLVVSPPPLILSEAKDPTVPAGSHAPLRAAQDDGAAAPAPPIHSAMDRHTLGTGSTGAADDGHWRSFTLALAAAKGPQPLAAFERLFVQSYLPLCQAVDHGLADPRALHARDEFRTSFVRMYSDACPTFAATGKRPKMVFDAPDVAARMARLHGARSVQLLLASSMRFDIATLVKQELGPLLARTARLADEVILWSALPTTTSRQLDCLTRGPDALRGPVASEREPDAIRGRTVETIRRVKIGEAASEALAAVPAVAKTLADVIARHAGSLPPRTLLLVFGDHGFTIDGAGVARSGGASPEEVLVPAFAMLVGDVH